MIDFKFNLIKTTQMVILFLQKNSGEMNYMKLIKLLYLTDREALVNWERPLTGDKYVSMRLGPVLSKVKDIIDYGERYDEYDYWLKYITSPSNYEIRLKEGEMPTLDKLSEKEIEIINYIDGKFKGFNQWEMVDICHDILPEWEDTGETSKPIEIKTIFEKEGKTKEEIERINEEVENLNYVKKLLSIED